MNTKRTERLLKTKFTALSGDEIDEMGESYYFPLLLIYHDKYESIENFNAILSWLDKNTINNKRLFIEALSSFIFNLNYQNYNEITSLIKDKERKPIVFIKPLRLKRSIELPNKNKEIDINENPVGEEDITIIERRNKIEKSPNKNNDAKLKLIFLDWVDKRLLDEYTGERKSEIANRDETHSWIGNRIEEIQKSNVVDSGSNPNIKNTKKVNVKASNKLLTLFDIWVSEPDKKGNKEQYKEHIDFLKKINFKIDTPFVTQINDKLQWNQTPQRGWQQYMAGFIYTCMKNLWIADKYTSPDFVEILNNTFNAKPNKKWFKSISTTAPHNPKYLEPFNSLPANK